MLEGEGGIGEDDTSLLGGAAVVEGNGMGAVDGYTDG